MSNKISRRKFISIATGGAIAIGTAAYGYNEYFNKPIESMSTETPKINNPPYADFEIVSPRYILPTVKQDIHLRSTSKDEDGDPLTKRLYVNDVLELETDSNDLHFKFKEVGTNRVRLEVSDGELTSEDNYDFDVEPDELPDYPQKSLNVKHKGICYYAVKIPGFYYFYTKSLDQVNHNLDTIKNELGCNAITITGDAGSESSEDHLIHSCKLALEKKFERVYIHPRHINRSVDETIERLVKFAPKVKSLREESEKVVFLFAREYSLEQSGIIRGGTWHDRLSNLTKGIDWNRITSMVGPSISKTISALNESYGYELAYAAGNWEAKLVPWNNPAFESVMINAYITEAHGQDEKWVINLLKGLKKYEKPIISSEWGCYAFTGAGKLSGTGGIYNPTSQPENQKEQADYIIKYQNMLNKVKIDGSYYVLYDEPFPQSEGLVNGKKRKLAFYALKSYQIGS